MAILKHIYNLNEVRFILTLILVALTGCGNRSGKGLGRSVAADQQQMEIERTNPDWAGARLVWSDEFNGDALDTSKWQYETGANGWGNHEWQNYVADGNVEVSDGTLKIIARKTGEGQRVGDYTSARLHSRQDFTYGKIEFRARIPQNKGNGLWPALWMLGSNISEVGWPACGELDIMENVSYEPDTIHFSVHSTAHNHKNGTQITSGPVALETLEEEFHTFGLLWTDRSLKFYVDSPENIKLDFSRPKGGDADAWPFSRPFYILMNLAVGGDWGGQQGVDDRVFPAVFEIDYVRVYQLP